MPRFLCITAALALTLGLLAAGGATAQTCGNNNSGGSGACDTGGGSSCTPISCARQYTSAPLIGRDSNNQCLYQCNWTNTTTDTCGQTMVNGSAYRSAGPWSNDYCEPAVDPTFFCGYFFGTNC